jgi:predicted phage terminase large subunit-like protein
MHKTKRRSINLSESAKLAAADRLMRQDLESFLRVGFETIVPGEELHLNWHLKAIAHALEKVLRGETKRLIITMPPRSLKSIFASVALPAFILGQDPSKKIICASYSAELAEKHAIDFRNLMKSPFYRRVFPQTLISRDKDTATEVLTTRRGGRYATSVGGTLTGRGGNLLIIDDPMNPKQAMSETHRKNVIEWYRQTAFSRLNQKGEDAIIVVMQRLHVDDLVGVLLDEGGWEHLDLPAIADRDESVPLGNGKVHRRRPGDVIDKIREPRHVLDEIKRTLGTLTFSSQYLQRPQPFEGVIIKREWLQTWRSLPPDVFGDTIISWDTAMSSDRSADYSVGTVWKVHNDGHYLLDVIRGQYNFPQLKRAVLACRQRYPGASVLIEDTGSGTSLIQELKSEQISVIKIKPVGDKQTRLYGNSALFEGGGVLFPEKAVWLDDLTAELLAFPNVRNDDQVDSISQALTWSRTRQKPVLSGVIAVYRSSQNSWSNNIW